MAASSDPQFSSGIALNWSQSNTKMVTMTDGFLTIQAYVAGDTSRVVIGQTYNVYKQGATYMLGELVDQATGFNPPDSLSI
jgi:hypothetical protein